MVKLTSIGRSAIKGRAVHYRGPSDDHTGERSAGIKGIIADGSHG